MADEWDSVIDFGGGDWSSVVDFGNTAVVEPPAMGMADSLRARSEIPSPYDRIRQREDALRAQLKAQGVPDDQMEQAIYQANISDAARMGLEAQPRNFITESTPYRAGEAAVTSLRNNLASTTYGAISNVADAVGADSLAQSTDYLHDIAQGDKQLQAATQEHLNKKAWIGETLSSWTVGAGQAVGESMAIGATAGTPAGALKTIAGYFAANTFDDAVSEGKPIGEATAQALIEGAWTLLAGKIIGAPLERLAAGASGAKVGEGAVGALAKYVSSKLPIRKELAQLAIGPLAEASEEWGTEISHWLVDVYNGRKPFTLSSMWESTKGVIGPALVSGGAAEGVPSGVRYVFDTLDARRKALPTISRAFEDAQEYEGDVPPSDRRGFSEATGKNHRNKEYREAFTAAVAANRAFAEDASATGEQGAEPDLRGPRLETQALTPDQLKQHNRELAQLRKVDPQTADELAKMYPQEAAQILSAAGEMAAAENEYLRNLQAQYREVIGDGRQAWAKSARAAKSAAKGNDETSVPRYDHISDRLHEPEYAELASEASKLGHGDINSGILELIAGGAARFEPTLKASDYAADQLEKYKQSTQGQPVVAPQTQEELANGNQVQTQGEVQGEGQTQGNAQGQEVLASEPQPVSQPVAVSQPTGPAAVIENHRQRAEQEFGVKIQIVEPSTADHQEAIELGKERGLTVVLFNQGEGGDGNLNGFAVPGGKIAFVRADHRGNALFGLIGHEASHATGFDAKTSAEEQLVDKYTQLYYDEAPPSIQEKMDADSEYARREGKSRLVQELFANKDFRNQLRGKMPSFWARIKRAIKQVLGTYTPKDRFAQEVLAEFGVKTTATAETVGSPMASMTRRDEDNPRKLANFAKTADAREHVRILDELMGAPERRHDEEVQAEAADRMAKDYAGERSKVIEAGRSGGTITDTQAAIAKNMFQEEWDYAQTLPYGPARDKAMLEIVQLHGGYRAGMTENARALRQGFDPLGGKHLREATPKQRFEKLIEKLLEPPAREKQRRQWALDNGMQRLVDRLDKKHAKRLANIDAELAQMGLSRKSLEGISRDYIATQRVINMFNANKATFWDKVVEFHNNAMLAGAATHVTNVLGNVQSALDLFVQAPLEIQTNRLMKFFGAYDPTGRMPGEMKYIWDGIQPGWAQGKRNAMIAFQTEAPVMTNENNWGATGHTAIGSVNILGKRVNVGRAIRLGGYTPLQMADEFATALYANMSAGASAYRLGKMNGLDGKELQDFINHQLTTPNSMAWRMAQHHALELTYHQKLTGFPKAVHDAANWLNNVMPIPVIDLFVAPFRGFPIRAGAVALRKTPAGSLALGYNIFKNIREGRPAFTGVSRRLTEQFIALSITGLLLHYIQPDDPIITGASKAPDGYPRTSIKILGKWYNYGRLEPISTVLSMIVDGIMSAKTDSASDKLAAIYEIPKDTIGNKTFLRGIADILDLFGMTKETSDSNTLDRVVRWSERYGESFVPNFYKQLFRASRESREEDKVIGTSTKERVKSAASRFASAVAPVGYEAKIDAWGRRMSSGHAPGYSSPATDFIWRTLSPVYNTDQGPTVGDRIYARYNATHPDERIRAPRPVQPYPILNGQRYALSEAEYEEYQILAGTLADQAAERVSQLPGFNVEAPTEANMKLLEKAVDAAKNQARVRLRPKWRASRPVSPATRTAS